MKLEHGDRKLCGTYWSERGPVRIDLEDYVWDEKIPGWVPARSPRGTEVVKETAVPS